LVLERHPEHLVKENQGHLQVVAVVQTVPDPGLRNNVSVLFQADLSNLRLLTNVLAT
jgi:hypothetical protein